MIPEDRAETLDTSHTLVVLVGLVVIAEYTFQYRPPIPVALIVAGAWTLGYYIFVKRILPPRWSGQKQVPRQ